MSSIRETCSSASPRSSRRKELRLLFEDDETLDGFIRSFGPAATVRVLSEGQAEASADCHPRAHEVGRTAYHLYGAAAFSLSSHECQAGSFHGATEALFAQRGTANLVADVTTICSTSATSFVRFQCVHGVGHGLMAWTSYELFDALSLCDQLADADDQTACFSGVFMENVVGGLSSLMGHRTEFLSDDPHFPRNVLSARHVAQCYYYQTSHMVRLFDWDFSRVTEACLETDASTHRLYFLSLGRNVGNVTRGDPARAIELCGIIRGFDNRLDCLEGAVQDRFWDRSGEDEALTFCALLEDEDGKRACHWTIIHRARDVYSGSDGFASFCARVEEPYAIWCEDPNRML